MRTTVRVHRLAEPALLAWARSLAAAPAEAFGLAETFYSAVEAELVRTNGRPDRSFAVPRISPETRAWTSRLIGIGLCMWSGNWLAAGGDD
jgi:hypothetical protein